jgi:hypothetical protein
MARFSCMSVLALAVLAVAGAAWAGDTGPPTVVAISPSDSVPQHPCLPGDDCSPPPPPPPAPPPSPPPPPPPPSFPACGDGWDNDGDGLIDYLSDPGCSSETDPDEYNAPEPPPPPPPPPPAPDLNAELAPSDFSTWSSAEGGFFGTRCKTQFFSHSFTQVNLYNVIRYEGRFQVCYVPGGRIVSWSDVHGDATWVRAFSGWEWRGNEDGYPYGVRTSYSTVQFRYRGKAAFCIFSYGCGPEKHPWVTLTFFSNNTMTRTSGAV